MADELAKTPGVPPAEAIQADLAACEALVAAGRIAEAEQRLDSCEGRLDPRTAPANWGEFLRIRGAFTSAPNAFSAAYHDFAQSANVFELLGERYQAALSQLALGRLAASDGHARRRGALSRPGRRRCSARSARSAISTRSKRRDALLAQALAGRRDRLAGGRRRCRRPAPGRSLGALPTCWRAKRRLPLLETTEADAAVVFVVPAAGEVRVVAMAGCDAERGPRARARRRARQQRVRRGAAAHRAARPRSRRPAVLHDRRGSAPDGECHAPLPHVRRGRAAGIRVVRRPRAAAASRSSRATNDRSSRCCPDSSAPARR